jgi:hypothetical protein
MLLDTIYLFRYLSLLFLLKKKKKKRRSHGMIKETFNCYIADSTSQQQQQQQPEKKKKGLKEKRV